MINYYYLDDIDEEQVEDWMYKGVMAGLEDPYADYYSKEELKSLMESTSGSYKGIGAIMTQDKDTGEISVVKCYEGTPAAESGLLPGDIVTGFNGEDTSSLDLTAIHFSLRMFTLSYSQGTTICAFVVITPVFSVSASSMRTKPLS